MFEQTAGPAALGRNQADVSLLSCSSKGRIGNVSSAPGAGLLGGLGASPLMSTEGEDVWVSDNGPSRYGADGQLCYMVSRDREANTFLSQGANLGSGRVLLRIR